MKPPFKYMGGKAKLAKTIVEYIPQHKVYVEPFFGAGAVFFAKEPSKIEIINDKDNNVYNFFKQLRENFDALMHYLKNMEYSERLYQDCKTISKTFKEANDVYRAALFFFNAYISFGGKINGGFSYGKTRVLTLTVQKAINRLPDIKERLLNALIHNRDYTFILEKYDSPDTFFYLDPPYRNTSKYLCHINHDEFYNRIKMLQGKWILSEYLTPELQEIFADYQIIPLKYQPSIGAGIGNRSYGQECIVLNVE